MTDSSFFRPYIPNDIAIAACSLSDASIESIDPREQAIALRFHHQARRNAFIAGRCAAAKAQQQLFGDAQAVLRSDHKEPLWPTGRIGSITHTKSIAFAVTAHATDYHFLGIDVEERREFDYDISRKIATPKEQDWIRNSNSAERTLMLFTAKEAIFKAIFPVCKKWFGFQEAELTWNDAEELFTTELKFEVPLQDLKTFPVYIIRSESSIGALTFCS